MAKSAAHVGFAIKNAVATIRLDRADRRNALTRAMIERITECVVSAAADETVRLIVLAANGSVFCAGMDLGEMQQRATSDSGPEEWQRDSQVYRDLVGAILDAPQPVLASVQGPVLAGGVGIVLACDLVIASESAFLALPEPQRGITAAMVTPLLTYRTGAGNASRLLLSSQRIPSQDAMPMGLFHATAPVETFGELETQWIESILKGSPMALAATKANIRKFGAGDLFHQLDEATNMSGVARETEDAREGLQAFLEKRKPTWQVGE